MHVPIPNHVANDRFFAGRGDLNAIEFMLIPLADPNWLLVACLSCTNTSMVETKFAAAQQSPDELAIPFST